LIGFTRWIGDFETTIHALSIERSKKLFPILLLCCLMLFNGIIFYKYLIIRYLTLYIVLFFNIYSYWFYTPEVAFIQRQVSLDAQEFNQNKSLASLDVGPDNPVVLNTFNSILGQNYWNFPSTFYENKIQFGQIMSKVDSTLIFSIDKETRSLKDIDNKRKSFYYITNQSLESSENYNFSGSYLLLKSHKSIFVLPTFPFRNSKFDFLQTRQFNRKGFNVEFENRYPDGEYLIGILSINATEKSIRWSKQTLSLSTF
jgi:hypothetical protein